MEPRDKIAMFRDSILSHLKESGTQQACKAIRRITDKFPDLDWLKWTLLEAQALSRRRTWTPPRPADILAVASNRQNHLVQNGNQLLDVLIESLKRLEGRLHGETPSAIDLWNEIGKNVYEPKHENELSDYIKRHLDQDLKQAGIIVNREVEIRRGSGSGLGERTDIHVDAIMREQQGEEYNTVTAIIETKGCWNPELDCAMKTQLMDRYLKESRCQYGLYLVGWFNCDRWNDNDQRKKKCKQLSICEAQIKFDTMATELSKEDMRIKALVINTALPPSKVQEHAS